MPSSEKSINELGNEFYSLMGNAISQWAIVEQYLFKVCRSALGCTTKRAAIVYHRTPTMESRRLLVDELLKTRLPEKKPPSGGHDHPDTLEWKAICSDMESLLPIRNRIAHQPMGPRVEWEEEDGGEKVGKRDLWFEISMSDHELSRKEQAPLALDLEALRQHIQDVWDLKEQLAAFSINTLPKYAPRLP
jgi:hypothetical protein